MRICSPQLGLSPDSRLGGEVHDRELLKSLADLGVHIDIILPLGKKHDSHKNWHFYYLPTPVVYPPVLFNLLIVPYLFWIHHRHHFSILRIHSPYFVGLAAVLLRYFHPHVKLVATYHHLEESLFLKHLNRLLIPKFDLVTTVSSATKENIQAIYGPHAKKIFVIPNGVSSKYISQPKNPSLLTKYSVQNKTILLYLGQLTARKNISFLIDLISLLPERYHLMICGSGDLFEQIEKLIINRQLKHRVTLTGFIPEDKKVEYYNLADIFVYPSYLEGFGLSVLEAMACGKPVISSLNPSFAEIIANKKSGFILPLDPLLWSKTIRALQNPKLYSLITRSAVTRAKQFSWSKSAQQYLQILNS